MIFIAVTMGFIAENIQELLSVRTKDNDIQQNKTVATKICNPEIFVRTKGNGNEIKRVSGNPPLRTTDNELLQELAVFAVYMHGTKKGVLDTDEKMKQAGSELIDY